MTQIEYGWALIKRLEMIENLSKNPSAPKYETKVNFMGGDRKFPVFSIPIGFPKYRLENGRTSSLQLEWLANNPNKEREYFTLDPERTEVQQTQHELLKKLINEKDLYPYFADIQVKQEEYLILDSNGFVINGNRRLCTWRELFYKDTAKYSHFNYIDVIFLPPSDPQAIDKLEGKLQVDRDKRADYSWHALANMILARMQLHGFDIKTIAETYQLSELEIKRYLDMRSYAEAYLISRDKEGKWSELEDEYAFVKLVEKRKLLKKGGEKKLFEAQAFILIDDPSGGRVYQSIQNLNKYRNEVRTALLEAFPIKPSTSNITDLLGNDLEDEINILLAETIDNVKNREDAMAIIKDTIDTQMFLKKEENTTNYVFSMIQKANTAIQNAIAGTNSTDMNKEGISAIIQSVEDGLNEIKKWLNK